MIGTVRTVGTGFYAVDFDGVAATTGGAIASIPNPEGCALMITRSFLVFRTESTGAANLNVGVGVAATTNGTDMISALAAASTTGKAYNASAIIHATKTEMTVDWPAAYFVNVTGDATTIGMKATLYIEYIRLT